MLLTLVVVAVIFLATLIRSTFGFGEALIAVPLLAFVLPVEVAAPVAVLVSITVEAIVVAQDWRHVQIRSASWLVFSTLFGLPIGLVLLRTVPESIVKLMLGHSHACMPTNSRTIAWRGCSAGSRACSAALMA